MINSTIYKYKKEGFAGFFPLILQFDKLISTTNSVGVLNIYIHDARDATLVIHLIKDK